MDSNSPLARGLCRPSMPEKPKHDARKNSMTAIGNKRNSQLVPKKSEQLMATPYGQHVFDQYLQSKTEAKAAQKQKKLRNISPQVIQKIIEFKNEKPTHADGKATQSLTRAGKHAEEKNSRSHQRKTSGGSTCSGASTYMAGQRSSQEFAQ